MEACPWVTLFGETRPCFFPCNSLCLFSIMSSNVFLHFLMFLFLMHDEQLSAFTTALQKIMHPFTRFAHFQAESLLNVLGLEDDFQPSLFKWFFFINISIFLLRYIPFSAAMAPFIKWYWEKIEREREREGEGFDIMLLLNFFVLKY